MAKGDDIQERLIDFAVSIIQLTTKLPKSSTTQKLDFLRDRQYYEAELLPPNT